MLKPRVSAICIIVGLGLFGSAARGQDCDRFYWQCQGWSGPRAPTPLFRFGPPAVAPERGPPIDLNVPPDVPESSLDIRTRSRYAALYGPVGGEPFPIPAVNLSRIDPVFLRSVVEFPTREAPGTIIIDPHRHYLYLVLEDGLALRYGVGVGRQGFGWSGIATVHDKQKWPDWYPPKEMLQRQPEIIRQMSELQSGIGMHGGPRNPLGARALYLWQGNRDTLYRIHGTVEPWTIGKSISSGCIRMINQDVLDLYRRTAVG